MTDLEKFNETFKVGTAATPADESNPDLKTYHGSCHCGHIKYSVKLNLKEASPSKCNCTQCVKAQLIGLRPKKPSDLTIISPAAPAGFQPEVPAPGGSQLGPILEQLKSDPDVGIYRVKIMNAVFCKLCGIRTCLMGWVEQLGVDMLTVHIPTLDSADIDFAELSKPGKLKYWDMRNDNWMAGGKDEPYPLGFW